MEKTNVLKEKNRLEVSLTIKKGKGYKFSKNLAKVFRENGMKYGFQMEKFSTGYFFKHTYVKVYFPFYDNGKVEITTSRYDDELKSIVKIVLSLLGDNVNYSQKNVLFLNSNAVIQEDTLNIKEFKKKVYENFSYNQEGKIFDVITKINYKIQISKESEEKLILKDNCTLSLNIQKGMLEFLMYFIKKSFDECSSSRNSFLEKIEEI